VTTQGEREKLSLDWRRAHSSEGGKIEVIGEQLTSDRQFLYQVHDEL
jgi:hypothetical protein